MDIKQKRNFVLVGHAQSGKTSLSEAVLFFSKATSRKGDIAGGTTISDYGLEEIERKVSINSSFLICNYKGNPMQIIDTPGYADFIGELVSSLRAVDAAVVLVDALSGVEIGTERAWELLDELNIPRIIFINKLDKENTDLHKALLDIQNNLSKKAHAISSLDSPALLEAVVETEDRLLEKYLEGTKLADEEIKRALRQATLKCKIYPVLGGSALTDKGIKELLEAIVDYFPSPIERPNIQGADAKTKEERQISLSDEAPFSAFVFKTISDPYVGQLSMLRVFSGKLVSNTGFYNLTKEIKERIGQIYTLQGKEQRAVDSASCGDIVALSKLKDTTTSDSLGEEKEAVIFAPIVFPEPSISASVRPKSRQDEEKISNALSKLSIEDPTFKISRDPETKELIISGIGDLHLDIMVEKMKKRFSVEVELGIPKVPYKETIVKTAKVQGKYKRQSGGRGQYGDVWLDVEPLPRGSELEFVDKVFGGAIPKNFIPAVEKGVKQAAVEGVVAGYPLVDVKVTLFDGSFHAVDSSDMAFQIAGSMALRKAIQEASPVLLEPIMDIRVIIPEEYMGQISGDLNSRRGRIMGMEIKGKLQVIKANVPLAEVLKYATDLRSMTGGRGVYTMQFSHYEEVPQKIASAIISQSQKKKEEDSG